MALGWHPRHLQAVLAGDLPPDPSDPVVLPSDVVGGRLAAIEGQLRAIEDRLIDVQARFSGERGGNGG